MCSDRREVHKPQYLGMSITLKSKRKSRKEEFRVGLSNLRGGKGCRKDLSVRSGTIIIFPELFKTINLSSLGV